MKIYEEYLSQIDILENREIMRKVLNWVLENFPDLIPEIKWNQPMFTYRGTYIIGFSAAKKHLSVAPEMAGIKHFADEIVKSGYDNTKELMRIPWNKEVNYTLLKEMIKYNITDKEDCTTFWR